MLIFQNTECPECHRRNGFFRIKRTWLEKHVTHRHAQKAKCCDCDALVYLGGKRAAESQLETVA